MKTISKEELRELYEKDFPLWAQINLELLKEKAFELVDWENLLEEIEDMAQKHLDSCISQLARILEHMYKWDHFRELAGGQTAGKGWIKSVENARDEIETILEEYPSLKKKIPQEIERAWRRARKNLRVWLRNNDYDPEKFRIPEKCPYTYDMAMNRNIGEVISS
ncbi:MAG: DUF29 domain-containing protein [Aquificaceae bacterium]|jgi:sugar-specific transcriptional regulator TrmB|uniref:DUF29 domain-containing protein n=1 Tax=Hydrogenobacter sp. Uz 6-8 TaxID=3384828 RepID=UPI000F14B584|nr:MAG: DUF29 domain-containing protein [Aquificota bacterium]